jgi:hypothetical protein
LLPGECVLKALIDHTEVGRAGICLRQRSFGGRLLLREVGFGALLLVLAPLPGGLQVRRRNLSGFREVIGADLLLERFQVLRGDSGIFKIFCLRCNQEKRRSVD